MIPCGTTYDLRRHLDNIDQKDFDIIFIHTGVNNIDTCAGKSVSDDLVDIVHKLRTEYPSIKIIVSEITPRQLQMDNEVLICNKNLHASLEKVENVTIALHSNLRNERWSFHKKNDDKHFSKISISRFAANIKIAFRKAIGLSSRNKQGSGSALNKNIRRKNNKDSLERENVHSFKKELINFLNSYKGDR